ncbi:MAG: MFS transporter [Eubacteriales bacterium]|nr:MFS transporter [Eubacteriales bacterium]
MYSLLLVVIYVAFISLGLPDALLGSAWPVMQAQWSAPVSFAGVISMTIAGGTIVSSLLSDRLTRRLGAGLVTAISVLMTAIALFGFSISTAPWLLILWAIPYGLGAGAVDAALNNYVALHYSSRHMSWLHCFWGVGASLSPFIMSYCLTNQMGWSAGYRTVSIIQIVLTAFLFLSLPLWKKREGNDENGAGGRPKRLSEMLHIKGVPYVLLTFFGYCAMESTAGLWASSYLVMSRGIDVETAARFASLYYLGITAGRFVNGFVTDRFGDRTMIRIGLGVILISIVGIILPFNSVTLVCLVLLGVGSAPIYPCVIHATPISFGKDNSQAIIGVQMASAYLGSTFMPPIFGLLAQWIGVGLYPWVLLAMALLMVAMSEKLNKTVVPS